jgi:hypothetical protein
MSAAARRGRRGCQPSVVTSVALGDDLLVQHGRGVLAFLPPLPKVLQVWIGAGGLVGSGAPYAILPGGGPGVFAHSAPVQAQLSGCGAERETGVGHRVHRLEQPLRVAAGWGVGLVGRSRWRRWSRSRFGLGYRDGQAVAVDGGDIPDPLRQPLPQCRRRRLAAVQQRSPLIRSRPGQGPLATARGRGPPVKNPASAWVRARPVDWRGGRVCGSSR